MTPPATSMPSANHRSWWLAAGLAAGMVLAASTLPAAGVRYRVTDLGDRSGLRHLNNRGQAMGQNWDREIVFFDGTQVHSLGTLGQYEVSAKTLNESGQITGAFRDGPYERSRPFLWNQGTFTDLMPLLSDFPDGLVMDINAYGEMIGYSEVATWSIGWAGWRIANGVVTHLGGLDPLWVNTTPEAINNSGWITGQTAADIDPGPIEAIVTRAFLWRDGKMVDLGTFGGDNSRGGGLERCRSCLGSRGLSKLLGAPSLRALCRPDGTPA